MQGVSKSISGFDPRSIVGCSLWLDAADAGSITGTTTVTAWTDKSGRGNNAGFDTNKPSYIQSGNYIETSNNNTHIRLPVAAFTNTTNQTCIMFIVYADKQTGTNNQGLFSTLDYGLYQLLRSSYAIRGNIAVSDSNYTTFRNRLATTNTVLYSIQYTVGVIGSSNYVVSAYGNSWIASSANNYQEVTGDVYLGGIASFDVLGDIHANLKIYEVLVYNNVVLSTTQRQSVEGYLAWKWGLQVQVPAPVQTPLSISGCQLWLDASDTSKIAPSAGGTLTSWTDKSGTGKTVTVASAPSYSLTSFNGLPSVTFASGNSLTIPITAPGTNDIAMFAVWKLTDGTASRDVLSIGSPGGSETAIGWNSSAANYLMYRYGGAQSTAPTSYSSNITIIQSGTQVSGYRTVYINGTSPSTNGTETYNQTNTSIYIGGGGNAYVLPLIGQVAEIIYYQATLSTTQRQSVENYLMGKWGIKPSLPAIHPFYSIPSFSRPFQPIDVSGCALWLDGADLSTITGSSPVTAWKDKANGYSFTGTGAVNSTNSLLGSNCLQFNYASYLTFNNGTSQIIRQPYTVFAVANAGAAPATWMRVFNGLSNTGYDLLVFLGTSNGYAVLNSGDGVTNAWNNNNPIISPNVLGLNTWLMTAGVVSNTTIQPYTNGSVSTLQSGTLTAGSLTGLNIGGGYGTLTNASAQGWNGYIGEIIFYNGVLNNTQRQQVEGYLAAKWGLRSSVASGHPFKSIPPSTSQPPQFQEVTPGNWKYDWQPYLSNFTGSNSSITPTTSNLTGITGGTATYTSGGWCGGVLAPNGNIYFGPNSAANVFVLNPTTGATSNLTGITGATATYTANGWAGGVLAPNGNIYFAPHRASNVLVLTPTTGATSNLSNAGTTFTTTGGWFGGVLAPNGNIYFAPYNAANILVLNPTTGATSNLTGGATYTSQGWRGGVLAPNGNIYFAPYNAANILVLNPTTGVTSNLTGITGGTATFTIAGWWGGALAPNGNIYFAPYAATNVLVLNPTTGSTSNLTGIGSGGTYSSGCILGPNGNIYFAPYGATAVGVLNPTTGATSSVSNAGTTFTSGGWFGGVLAPNGNIYFGPYNAANVLKLTFASLPQTPSSNYCLSPWTNKI